MSSKAKSEEIIEPSFIQPSIHFEQIIFSDDTCIPLEPNDIVVLVGPNNAGKSAAIRELYNGLGKTSPSKVVKSVVLKRNGSNDDLRRYLRDISKHQYVGGMLHYSGAGYNINAQHVDHYWNGDLTPLRDLLSTRIETESRIVDSNPQGTLDVLNAVPAHPIQQIYMNDNLENKINNYFRRAFGSDLILDRGAGSFLPLRVGLKPDQKRGQDRNSYEYLIRLREQTAALQEQGDGMRSFTTVLLRLLSSDTPRILFLDEPEAFLHPPQARLLGEFIAKERPKDSQLFVATHSADVLQGMLDASPQGLKLIGIQRDGAVNRTKLLEKAQAKRINTDPLMRYSGAVAGIFHHRVIVTESGADSMFYAALLDLPAIHGDYTPDVMFVDGGGKHRLAALARMLRSVDVTVDVVADFDLLNDSTIFLPIIEALGGHGPDFEPNLISLQKAVNRMKPPLTAGEVSNKIQELLSDMPPNGTFPKTVRNQIEALFKKTSPWEAIKQAGASALPSGEATKNYNDIVEKSSRIGLWIVPVGEMERFCPSIGGHGPKWVQEVLETLDISDSKELEVARQFVTNIWNRTAQVTPESSIQRRRK